MESELERASGIEILSVSHNFLEMRITTYVPTMQAVSPNHRGKYVHDLTIALDTAAMTIEAVQVFSPANGKFLLQTFNVHWDISIKSTLRLGIPEIFATSILVSHFSNQDLSAPGRKKLVIDQLKCGCTAHSRRHTLWGPCSGSQGDDVKFFPHVLQLYVFLLKLLYDSLEDTLVLWIGTDSINYEAYCLFVCARCSALHEAPLLVNGEGWSRQIPSLISRIRHRIYANVLKSASLTVSAKDPR